ncbi:MAG: hypothetical protein AB1467_01055 [Candidatus Diapherotrites archaeon]
MQTDLWKECLTCKDKCCKWDIAFPLFVTNHEKRKLSHINTRHPCLYFNRKELCEIYPNRPFDCRFFPFNVWESNGKFYWMIWKLNCPILNKNKEKIELYLQEHEKKLIHRFKNYLNAYSKFRLEELIAKYQYEVLRKVKFNSHSKHSKHRK